MPWPKDKRRPNKRKRMPKKKTQPIPQWLTDKIAEADVIVGADECGWGCLAGPVVVAACVLPRDYAGPVFKDSKRYSSERTREQAEKLVKDHAFRYATFSVSAYLIAQMGPTAALDYAYESVIYEVLDGTDYLNPLIVIDGSRKVPQLKYKHYTLPKGDARLQAIAAASILGKCWRDRYMTELTSRFPEFDFKTHKGYPTSKHCEELKRFGITVEHRQNIEFCKEILEKVGKYDHGT